MGVKLGLFTLREEHRQRVFENRVLRRIFGSQREEVTGEWRRLHKEDLYDLYSSSNIVWAIKLKIMRWAELVARMGDRRDTSRVLVWRPDGKRPLGRPRRRWEVNIKMYVQEVAWTGLMWLRIGTGGGRL
jgi:hypothetical protein